MEGDKLRAIQNIFACDQKIFVTFHAEQRMQQRGVPLSIIPHALKFGTKCHAKGGKVKLLCKRQDEPRMKSAGLKPSLIERLIGVPFIVEQSDQYTIIVTAHPKDTRASSFVVQRSMGNNPVSYRHYDQ